MGQNFAKSRQIVIAGILNFTRNIIALQVRHNSIAEMSAFLYDFNLHYCAKQILRTIAAIFKPRHLKVLVVFHSL